MTKRFAIRQLVHVMCATGLLGISHPASASGFALFEQDAASVGNYHAGRAVMSDASTAYYNPAGNAQFNNQELILGDVFITSSLKYTGTVSQGFVLPGVGPVFAPPEATVAQGGASSQIPDLNYVAPITKNVGFGFSIVAPFGLKTNYGRNTPLRYAATMSELYVVDYTPSLGISVNDKFAFGAGIDIQRMGAQLGQMGAIVGVPFTDTDSKTKGWDTGYGCHVGLLYHFNSASRIGLTYNSQVVHHVRGASTFIGPVAEIANALVHRAPMPIRSGNANARITLPASTTLSGFHEINAKWAVMGTVIYTQWNVFRNLVESNVAAVVPVIDPLAGVGVAPATNVTVSVPTHYRNTWNFSMGADYHATEKFTFRGGVGYDQSPVLNTYRDVRIPDSSRYVIALGGHYQANKTIGFDVGWSHFFMAGTASINPPPEVAGAGAVETHGHVKGAADAIGAQIVWDIV